MVQQQMLQVPPIPPVPTPPAVPFMPPQGPQPAYGVAMLPPMTQMMPTHAARMRDDGSRRSGFKFKVAFYATVLFAVLSHPAAYRVLNQTVSVITGSPHEVLSELGVVTMKGLFLACVLFFFLMLLLVFRGG